MREKPKPQPRLERSSCFANTPMAIRSLLFMWQLMQIEIRSGARSKRISELVTHWLINSLGLLLVSRSIKGIELQGTGSQEAATVFAAAAVLGFINVALKPFLVVLTLPINILSLGLFTLV